MANNTANKSLEGEKTSKFLAAIQKYADEQKDNINNEVEQFKAEELKKATDEGLQDAYNLIHKEMDAMRTAISSEMAKRGEDGKAVLFKKRAAITNEVFEKAKEQLKQFTSSEKYEAQLLANAKEIADFFGEQSVTVYVRKQDMQYEDKILKYFTGKCTVQSATDINVGGLRAVCTDTLTMIDKTLETKLEAQKTWFYQNSGLKVL